MTEQNDKHGCLSLLIIQMKMHSSQFFLCVLVAEEVMRMITAMCSFFKKSELPNCLTPSPSPHSSYGAPAHSARPPPQPCRRSTAEPGTGRQGSVASSQSQPRGGSKTGPAGRGLP